MTTESHARPETPDQVLLAIQKVISEVAKIEPAEIQLDSPVTGLRNVDSILLLEILVRTEMELGIEIDEQDLFDINTVRDFAAFCRKATA
ncbi:acyl carrier protein [Streptomyces sp. NPDC018833]|uniref:acyl carrier protein n=1 Tax=Streptomyces sp. NPDC018833 TaxID=3365053 RepID=UPI00379BC9B4